MFKVGDKVRCIDATYKWLLSDGVIYTVTGSKKGEGGNLIHVDEIDEWFFIKRFEFAYQYPTLSENYEQI